MESVWYRLWWKSWIWGAEKSKTMIGKLIPYDRFKGKGTFQKDAPRVNSSDPGKIEFSHRASEAVVVRGIWELAQGTSGLGESQSHLANTAVRGIWRLGPETWGLGESHGHIINNKIRKSLDWQAIIVWFYWFLRVSDHGTIPIRFTIWFSIDWDGCHVLKLFFFFYEHVFFLSQHYERAN